MTLPGDSYVEFMRRTYGHLFERVEVCEFTGVVVAMCSTAARKTPWDDAESTAGEEAESTAGEQRLLQKGLIT